MEVIVSIHVRVPLPPNDAGLGSGHRRQLRLLADAEGAVGRALGRPVRWRRPGGLETFTFDGPFTATEAVQATDALRHLLGDD